VDFWGGTIMKFMRYINPTISWILSLFLFWSLLLPVWNSMLLNEANASSEDELKVLVEELKNVAANISGQAGIEIRASIAMLHSELEARLNQLENIGKDLQKQVAKDMEKILNEIKKSIQDYTKEIKALARDRIEQLNSEMAKRLARLSDEIKDRLNQLDTIMQNAIKQLKESAARIEDKGKTSKLIIIDSFTKKIVKAGILILDIIVLLVIGILAWRNIIPRKIFLQVTLGIIIVGFFVVSGIFLFNNAALASVLGKEIQLVKPEVANTEGEQGYNDVMDKAKSGATLEELRPIGDKAIIKLKYFTYVAPNVKEAKQAQEKIDIIQALINPPPKPMLPIISDLRTFPIETFSKYYDARVTNSKRIAKELNIDSNLLFRTQLLRTNMKVK